MFYFQSCEKAGISFEDVIEYHGTAALKTILFCAKNENFEFLFNYVNDLCLTILDEEKCGCSYVYKKKNVAVYTAEESNLKLFE